VLYRRDVVPMEESATFDRTVHKAVKVQDTDDERSDQRIAQVLKRGFARAEKQLRPEEVVILRYRGRKD
jgi:molecular chaperone GrpE (heat shock protein)